MFKNSSRYQIIKESATNIEDFVIVSKYYQPIIGPVATLIYLNFLNEVMDNKTSKEISISKLQVYINTSIDKIFYALRILDKANLVDMYKSNDDDIFLFGLKKPLKKVEFFNDNNFSKLLCKQVGDALFEEIKSDDELNVLDLEKFSKLSGDAVIKEEPVKKINNDPYFKYFSSLELDNTESDIESLVEFSRENKLTKIDIETVLPICRQNNIINLQKFRKVIKVHQNDFEEEVSETLVEEAEDIIVEVTNENDAKIVFDKYDSETFLSKLSGGRELASFEKNLISSLRNDYKLKDCVINVLIDYVLLINDKNLNKNFVEAIAANWSRKGLSTSEQAMEFVRNYNKKRNEKKNELKGNIVPEWLNKDLKYEDPAETEKVVVVKEEITIDSNEDDVFDIFANFEGA